ncbi:MAG: GTP cyclohydrolase II RibA [Bacteroidales bacterium]|jgi:GTP cyclohydrolase II|nr:GTP cyclohydrolase II RibA [Bacteroidales bacterium]
MINALAKAVHHTKDYGDFDIHIVQDDKKIEHVVLIRGEISNGSDILCRISSECLPGTALFSAECDCEEQIRVSLRMINQADKGIFIYLRQEGRGHGLATKIRALALKNKGRDTFSAVEELGLQSDIREYSVVKDILELFQVQSVVLLSNNPDKVKAIQNEGIVVNSVNAIPISATKYSARHLVAKRERGHDIDIVETMSDTLKGND